MIAIDLGVKRVDELLRLVRALGAHRYVAGRLHLLHAFAVVSVGDDAGGVLGGARAWALATLERPAGELDPTSRDERLWRGCSDSEVVAVLDAFWTPGVRADVARDALRGLFRRHGLEPGGHAPFDAAAEREIHPMALDAGWELFRLGELDGERHKGAIAAFGDPIAFESARFEEQAATPGGAHLYELPALGATELLDGVDRRGHLTEPFVVWAQGNQTYLDYVFRGVQRAAKLT